MKIIVTLALLVALAGCGKKEDSCCTPTATTPTVERRKDKVCGMWVAKTDKAIKAEWDNADYYFCSEDCKKAFVKDTMKYLSTPTMCSCKKAGRANCQCDHCGGKREPCDCLND